jgi:Cdc6-like AAA superfamily ATPase
MSNPPREETLDLQTPEGVDDLYCTMIAPLIGESLFSRGFAPHKVLHRGLDISSLIKYFNRQLQHPHQPYNLALLSGPVGTGKHLIAHTAIQSLHLLLEAIYHVFEIDILCEATPLEILIQIFHQIAETSFPLASNMSIKGIVHLIADELTLDPNKVVFLILREVERLQPPERKELLNALAQISTLDAQRSPLMHLNIIILTNDSLVRNYITSQRDVIPGCHLQLLPYTEDQLYSIVQARAQYVTDFSYQSPAYTKAVLELVTRITVNTQPNAHLAINFLHHAVVNTGDITQLTPESLTQGLETETEHLDIAILDSLPYPQLLLLYSLARLLETQSVNEVTTPELKAAFRLRCSDLELKEYSDSRIAEFLKSLEGRGIISQHGNIGKVNHIRLLLPVVEVLRYFDSYRFE